MKRFISLLLFCVTFVFVSCTNGENSKPVAKDSSVANHTDTIKQNPAMPAAQNSDDPDRFSQ